MILKIVLCMLGMMGMFGLNEARAQFFLEQAKVSLDVSAGEHRNGSLLIHNTSAQPEYIKVYWEDFQYKAPYEGTKEFLPAGTSPDSVSQWVAFSPQEFSIPAYGKQNIDYTVTVPAQINEGHYGVLFFEKTTGPLQGETGLSVVTRIGCLFFVEPGNKSKKAVLQNVIVQGNTIKADYVNQGNVTELPRTTFYVMQDKGLVVLRGEAKKLYVPSGTTASLALPMKKTLDPGHYTLVLNSDLDEGDVVVEEAGLTVGAAGQITVDHVRD